MAFAAEAEEKISIRLGHIRDTNHPTHIAALKFKDMVDQKSGGRIEINVFTNSQLGGPKDMFAQMQTGDLVLHADIPGAPFTIVKTEGKTVSEEDILEAAQIAASYSSAWKDKSASSDVYWVTPEQVSKEAPSGEFLHQTVR